MKKHPRLTLIGVALSLVFSLAGIWPVAAHAQEGGRIEGTITLDNTGDPLHGARVLIIELGRSTLTDQDGMFVFEGVPAGTYQLLAVREHLQAARVTTTVAAGAAVTVDVALTLSAVHEEVTVTATGRETTAFDAFNSVQVLDSIDLTQKMAGTLGELLEGEPGVAKRSFGPGSSRPIIRGFDNDRVLIMQDGVRTGDLSSQSGDHGVSIDPGSLQRVEILKGPATLLYGSNAIGGVVNTISPQQQFYDSPPDELRGQINADLATTNDQAGGTANFQYGRDRFMTWFGGGGRRTSAYGTPDGEVENSQTEQLNGRVGAGWFGERSYVSGSYQVEDGRYGVPFAGDLHGEEEGGHVDELLIELDQRRQVWRFEGGLRDLDAGIVDGVKTSLSVIDWVHEEVENFPDGDSEVGTRFENDTTIGRVEVHQTPTDRVHGQFGAWFQRRDYRAIGEEALAPPTDQTAVAGFAYEEVRFDRFSLQLGGRLEVNRYRPDERLEPLDEHDDETGIDVEEEEVPEIRDRDFTGFSGSVGFRYPFADNRAAMVVNLTSSYRAPSLEELYNFGPHVGNLAFEIGNPDLEHERSNGGEVTVKLNSERFHGQASVFYYDIGGFIFGAPTGRFVDGLTELEFQQADSRFVGADMNVSFHPSARWRVHLGAGLVDAKLTATNEPLPRIPPLSARLAVDWLPRNGLQVRPELLLAAAQDDTFGEETSTDGYVLANLSASYTLAGAKTMHIFSLKATNLTDARYRNHTSFIKDQAPEMGRRLLLTYALRLF